MNLAGSREDDAEILEGFVRRQNPNPGREISGGCGKREGRLMAEVCCWVGMGKIVRSADSRRKIRQDVEEMNGK